jgi:hypothetical protein
MEKNSLHLVFHFAGLRVWCLHPVSKEGQQKRIQDLVTHRELAAHML